MSDWVFSPRSAASEGSPRPSVGSGRSHGSLDSDCSLKSAETARSSYTAQDGLMTEFHSPEPSVTSAPDSPVKAEAVQRSPDQVFSLARHGHLKEVKKLLDEGFDVNARDDLGNTLFIVACQNGHKPLAKLAAKSGCSMDAQNNRGNTGLHFLQAYRHYEMVSYFISKKCDTRLVNNAGKTYLEGLQ